MSMIPSGWFGRLPDHVILERTSWSILIKMVDIGNLLKEVKGNCQFERFDPSLNILILLF